jgi:hypothetical protein
VPKGFLRRGFEIKGFPKVCHLDRPSSSLVPRPLVEYAYATAKPAFKADAILAYVTLFSVPLKQGD